MVSQFKIALSSQIIRRGGVIAYPTETVYGLGCDPFNQQAVERLLAIKQRSIDKGLIIIAAQMNPLMPFIGPLTAAQYEKISQQQERPTTWIVPKASNAPYWLTGQHQTIAIRITTHPTAIKLCTRLGHALVSTSANLSGHSVAKTPLDICQQFGKKIDCVLYNSGQCLGIPSAIRDVLNDKIMRS